MYWVVGTSPTVTYGNGLTDGTTTGITATVTGLTCGTPYYVRVYAKTSCNGTNSNYATSSVFTTAACATNCITPGTPASATVTSPTQTTANLSWTTGTPVGSANVTYYWVVGTSPTVTYGSGVDEGTTTGTTATATGLTCGTQYYLRVYAKTSCNGTFSNYKTSSVFTTSACTSTCTTPTISSQPPNRTINPGSNTTFNVVATGGVAPYSYQWQVSTNSGSIWVNIATAGTNPFYSNWTTATLTLSGTVTSNNNYKYRCIIFSGSPCSTSSIPSNVGTLTINTPSPTITYTVSEIAPWQRANENYPVSIKATTSDGSAWTITAYNNFLPILPVTSGNFQSGQTGTFNFNFPNPNGVITYSIQSVSSNAVVNILPTANYKTSIIEEKWDKKNVVYYNNGSNPLSIPLKYISNARDAVIHFNIITGTSDEIYAIEHHGPIIGVPTNDFNVVFSNYGYLDVPNNNTSNLNTVKPAVFNYSIKYRDNSGSQIGNVESGSFDLTKIGQYGSFNFANDTLIIIIAGNTNTLENYIQHLNNHSDPHAEFSIAENFRYGAISSINANFNTWYIAQPNENFIENNAYDLGIGIDKILQVMQSNSININHIHIVCHSKGGLEVRSMLGNLGKKLDATYMGYGNNPPIESVTFLATPHAGFGSIPFFIHTGNAHDQLLNSSQFLTSVNNAILPANVRFLNITGNDNFTLTGGNIYQGQPSDGVVPVWSSEHPNLKYGLNNYFNVTQLYVSYNAGGLSQLHGNIHVASVLNLSQDICETLYSNLNRIFKFIRNGTILSCSGIPNTNQQYVINGSVLSGAAISLKKVTDTSYEKMGVTDENGILNSSLIFNTVIGDSIKIEAPQYEMLILAVNAEIMTTNKVVTSMFKLPVATSKIKYPTLKLINQNSIVSNNGIGISLGGQNILRYEINSPLNQDSIFVPLTLNNNQFFQQLDTGSNIIIVRFIGTQDTVKLTREVFYLPGGLMSQYTYNMSLVANQATIGTKVYVNNKFIRKINNINETVPVLIGQNTFRFYKSGYIDSIATVYSSGSINIPSQIFFHSYSSFIDSNVVNFQNNPNPQYWKNISLKNISVSSNVQVSAKQYDDAFSNMALIPQCRKFVFRNLTANSDVKLRTAISLDQIETPDSSKVYFLTIKNGSYKKYLANKVNVTEYDPEVQKMAFDSINLGPNQVQEIVLMKKQAPILKNPVIEMFSGETLSFPVLTFVADPDSIRNDITASSNDSRVNVAGNNVFITAPVATSAGTISVTISFTHDFITVTKTYVIKVLPPKMAIPSAFTPNNDGLNETFGPKYYGRLSNCHFIIFNRYGQPIFETTDCAKGWDGKVQNIIQQTGTFVWSLTYQFEGEKQKSEKGTVTVIN